MVQGDSVIKRGTTQTSDEEKKQQINQNDEEPGDREQRRQWKTTPFNITTTLRTLTLSSQVM